MFIPQALKNLSLHLLRDIYKAEYITWLKEEKPLVTIDDCCKKGPNSKNAEAIANDWGIRPPVIAKNTAQQFHAGFVFMRNLPTAEETSAFLMYDLQKIFEKEWMRNNPYFNKIVDQENRFVPGIDDTETHVKDFQQMKEVYSEESTKAKTLKRLPIDIVNHPVVALHIISHNFVPPIPIHYNIVANENIRKTDERFTCHLEFDKYKTSHTAGSKKLAKSGSAKNILPRVLQDFGDKAIFTCSGNQRRKVSRRVEKEGKDAAITTNPHALKQLKMQALENLDKL